MNQRVWSVFLASFRKDLSRLLSKAVMQVSLRSYSVSKRHLLDVFRDSADKNQISLVKSRFNSQDRSYCETIAIETMIRAICKSSRCWLVIRSILWGQMLWCRAKTGTIIPTKRWGSSQLLARFYSKKWAWTGNAICCMGSWTRMQDSRQDTQVSSINL